jgi:multiple sugar transport system permease protein
MRRARHPLLTLALHGALIAWLVYSVLPFIWTLLNSLKLPRDANARVPRFIFEPTGRNYEQLWLRSTDNLEWVGLALLVAILVLVGLALSARWLPVPRAATYGFIVAAVVGITLVIPRVVNTAEFYNYFLNSVIVSAGTVVISITIGCLAGYGLARYSGVIGVVILFVALAFRALPRLAFVLPFYYIAQATGLYDTHILLILTLVAVNQPFTIWMLRSFFMEIPRELEEAALIDGCNRIQAFIRVIIPIMWPGIITTALFTLLLAYNEFLMARILTQSNWTLPVAIAQYTGGEDVGYLTVAAAASVSVTLPIIVVIIFFQKYLVKGLAFGAVKG